MQRATTVLSPQVEREKQQEHEAQRLREHLALLLGALLEARPPSQGPSGAAELLQRCEALERKTATFENIVCVLNREVERVAMTAEACGRQHRLDQDRIEALSSKVCAGRGCSLPTSSMTSRLPQALGALFTMDPSRGPRWPCALRG